jgi:hypothetical protein
MIVSIAQPAYLPWLGYFDRIARSDLHIVLNTVQMERNTKTSFTMRNRVRAAAGPVWLTVPVRRAADEAEALICNAVIDGPHWARKHWQTLRQSYVRAPCFEYGRAALEPIYQRDWTRLDELLEVSTRRLLDALGITTPMTHSGELGVTSHKSQLVLDLCRAAGATTYLSGPFGRGYLDLPSFQRAGIEVVFHDYPHPVYHQVHGNFMPYLSVVDLLFNHGAASRDILAGGASLDPPLSPP